jgi:hypothetical protein
MSKIDHVMPLFYQLYLSVFTSISAALPWLIGVTDMVFLKARL